MKKENLAKRIKIDAEELEAAHVSEFNKKVLQELSGSEFDGNVDDKDVEKAEELLKSFLNETWAEEPQSHKYVINACLALAFLFERPMHPQEKVHYTSHIENGKEVFHCPYNQKGTVCDFCAAVPSDDIKTTIEYLDVVDEDGRPTGETVLRETAHRDGIRHRTAHVWIIRKTESGYDILLQKRSGDKDSFPGFFDTSSAGHIPSGVEPLPSALRELSEELGIMAEPEELTYAGSFRIQYEKEFHGRLFRDNEVTKVFVYSRPVDTRVLTLQKSEVDEVQWFNMEEVWEEIRTDRHRFCVPVEGLDVLRRFLAENHKRLDAC